jgi:hypothetical protein
MKCTGAQKVWKNGDIFFPAEFFENSIFFKQTFSDIFYFSAPVCLRAIVVFLNAHVS